MKLKKTQKNKLFEILEKEKFPLSMFKFIEGQQNSITIINEPYHFTFWEDSGDITYFYSPSDQWYEKDGNATDFDELIIEFYEWINSLEEELEAEDKWANFNNLFNSLNLNYTSNIENEKFSVSEYLELKEKINVLKNCLEELSLKQEEIKFIQSKLDLISEQISHLGKFDWRSLFAGTIMSIIIQLSLSQEQGKNLWQIIKRIFSNFFLTN